MILELHTRAAYRWGNRCPCCRIAMTNKTGRGHRAQPLHMRTRGHDRALSMGGSEWVFICNRCNNDQGSLDFRAWARKLIMSDDRRAEHVIELVAWLVEQRTPPVGAASFQPGGVSLFVAWWTR